MNGNDRLLLEDEIEMIRENIRKQFPAVQWPEPVMEPVFYGRLKKKPVLDRFAMLDINTGNVFDIVSGKYNLVTHEEVVHDLLSSVPAEFGRTETEIKLYDAGAKIRVDVTFPDIPEHVGEIKPGDKVDARVSAYSSYNRSTFHGVLTGAKQLVCSNGLVAFRSEEKKRRHINGSTITREQLTEEISVFLTDFSKTTDLWRTWANRRLEKLELDEVMVALPFSEPERDRIMELPLMNNNGRMLKQLEHITLWDVSSAATQFAKHEVRGEQRSMDLEQQIAVVLHTV